LAATLSANPLVDIAEPNYLITADQSAPNDPRFPEQWALSNTGQNGGQSGSDIGAPGAWAKTTGAASTIIAVVDSGIDFTHPDLVSNERVNPNEQPNGIDDDADGYVDDLNGWDYVTDTGTITDGQGHGTAVAGIIAATGNNGIGITGVMWQASLMSLRVLDSTGTGDVAHAVEAIDFAVSHGAQVINCSWGTDEASAALKDAIARAAQHDVVVVAGAGNSGRSLANSTDVVSTENLQTLCLLQILPSGENWRYPSFCKSWRLRLTTRQDTRLSMFSI